MQFNSMKALQAKQNPRRVWNWREYIVYIAFVVVFFVFAVTLRDDGFLSTVNLMNIVIQTASITIMAVAMTFVISSGEIDLSVGAVAALTSMTTALAVGHWGIIPAIFVGLGTGLVIGFVNGFLVTRIGIPSFLVTLGMMSIAKGLAMWITGTKPVPILNTTYNFIFGGGKIWGIPVLVLWTLAALIVGHIVLRKTKFGRQALATGGNEMAARYSGVPTRRIKWIVLTVSGMTAALAGMLYAGRMESGRFSFGEGDEMSVIAAVILGGTSLFGGYGTVIGTVIGAIMISMINNGLIIMGLNISEQNVVKGLIIILAVALSKKKWSA